MYEYLDRRYALALYEVAEERAKTEEFIKDLGDILNIINENEELLELIRHPKLSTTKKKELFENIFKGKTDEEVLSFLLLLIEKNRLLNLKGIIEEIKKIHLERNQTLLALVKTVVPLLADEKNDLIRKLELKYNKKIILNEEVDKDIIGGVYVRVGNDVIDGTIKTKFEEIRKMTLKTE
ncbi:F0F1 ATP synthase subunit delta [Candidatus Clostridium stratigraminis]|uniref:ATP synthase subunit delta n=1 Tax=Candidatus Clostridium stratigraminis TaxID=3381661 RepID=A0ABW8T610_9CLOT